METFSLRPNSRFLFQSFYLYKSLVSLDIIMPGSNATLLKFLEIDWGPSCTPKKLPTP